MEEEAFCFGGLARGAGGASPLQGS